MSWIDIVVAGAKHFLGDGEKQTQKEAFVPMFSADELDDASAEAADALRDTAALGENSRESQYYSTIASVLDNYKQEEGETAFRKLSNDLDDIMRA
tara:strand:+ start:498 stop:785 length:288 start_codon:yes stop_codon:yes gene_type:complete